MEDGVNWLDFVIQVSKFSEDVTYDVVWSVDCRHVIGKRKDSDFACMQKEDKSHSLVHNTGEK